MTTTTDGGVPATSTGIPSYFPQARLRIVATYHEGTDGDVLPAGQPANVDIEVNDPLPEDVAAFIDGLIASLFRHSPTGGSVQITNNTRSGVTR